MNNFFIKIQKSISNGSNLIETLMYNEENIEKVFNKSSIVSSIANKEIYENEMNSNDDGTVINI